MSAMAIVQDKNFKRPSSSRDSTGDGWIPSQWAYNAESVSVPWLGLILTNISIFYQTATDTHRENNTSLREWQTNYAMPGVVVVIKGLFD